MDTAILGAFAFMVFLIVTTLACAALVHIWHDWAADRRREAEYARAWQQAHRRHQNLGRYDYDVDGRPE